MSFPSENDVLMANDPGPWIDRHFLRQDPFVFSTAKESFHAVACRIASRLEVDRNGIFCIGSGAIGWSTNPSNVSGGKLGRFSAESDLDMAIVSSRHFEIAWRDLLVATQPHLREVPKKIEDCLSQQKNRLFDGAIMANKLLEFFAFGKQWQKGIDQICQDIAKMLDRNIDVGLWIYRDYWSLRNYVAKGLVQCQKAVLVSDAPGDKQ